jgi:deoxycytidylate deaminase
MNAARIGVALEDATIYVSKFPCLGCCTAIIQAGIKRIYTHDHRYWSDDPLDKEHFRKPIVLRQAGIQVDAPFHPDFSVTARLAETAKKLEPVPERKPPGSSTETLLGTQNLVPAERTGTTT